VINKDFLNILLPPRKNSLSGIVYLEKNVKGICVVWVSPPFK